MKSVLLKTNGGLVLKMVRELGLIELYFQEAKSGKYRLLGTLKGKEFWRAIVELYQEKEK